MPGDERQAEERSHRMAEEHDRRARPFGLDQPVEGPEVAKDLLPAAAVGEMSEVGRRRRWSVAAMVVGVDRVSGGVERRRETRIAGRMLGEAMGDLDGRPRRPPGGPTPAEKAQAVCALEGEFVPRHCPTPLGAGEAIHEHGLQKINGNSRPSRPEPPSGTRLQ